MHPEAFVRSPIVEDCLLSVALPDLAVLVDFLFLLGQFNGLVIGRVISSFTGLERLVSSSSPFSGCDQRSLKYAIAQFTKVSL